MLKLYKGISSNEPGIIDSDLAKFLGLGTKRINETARRNLFDGQQLRYQMSDSDFNSIKSRVRGGRRYTPFVYTFRGVVMIISRLRLNLGEQHRATILRVFNEDSFPIIDYGEGRPEEHIIGSIKTALNGIWDLHIHYPVKTHAGRMYFLDAYIPSMNIAIEVDENHHAYKKKRDALRQEEIEKSIGCRFVRFSEADTVCQCINMILREIIGTNQRLNCDHKGG